jgi:serine/threonine protein kinase
MSIRKNKIDLYRISYYEIDKSKKLGTGAYSTVYLARCTDKEMITKYNLINGLVAIKKINISNLNDKATKMVRDEISIMSNIMKNPHPNIISCIDIIDDLDTIYIIMEYCDGGDLSTILGNPIKEDISKYYFKQLINGLQYLTDNKIIHRDIKPKNILLTDKRTKLKICDFGFAKIKTGMTRISTVCGSPLYMAPEILGERNYTSGIDIWAIGMILYELIYGYHPLYKCKDIAELKDYMTNNSIEIPSKIENTPVNIDCINLLKLLLERQCSLRIKLEDINKHEWLTNTNLNNKPSQGEGLDIIIDEIHSDNDSVETHSDEYIPFEME